MVWTRTGDKSLPQTIMSQSLIARFMGPIWSPSEADRTQMGPMWAPWTLLSGVSPTAYGVIKPQWIEHILFSYICFLSRIWQHNCPFVRVICGFSTHTESPHTGPVIRSFCYFDATLNKLLNKHLICRCLESPWCSCGVTVMDTVTILKWLKIS